ncbi:hypothetical protein PINS_up007421 [Pythium insidiosum]|nr:hypothetical protein PINS_up007421 [Pythium insidiosum]
MAPPPHPSTCESEARATVATPRRARSAGSSHFEASFAASTSAAEGFKASVTSPVAGSISSINSSRMGMLSPHTRALMDPFQRSRKRLSADFSDLTFSGESCGSSPKSEKGGWRIHSAVAGPFSDGPVGSRLGPPP